jgi:hypothetical protein
MIGLAVIIVYVWLFYVCVSAINRMDAKTDMLIRVALIGVAVYAAFAILTLPVHGHPTDFMDWLLPASVGLLISRSRRSRYQNCPEVFTWRRRHQ